MDEQLYDHLLLAFADVLNNLSDISHVIDVLELAWSGQKLFGYFLEYSQSGQNYRL